MSTAFADWIELSSEYSMAEVVIPEKWVGRSLSELKIREQYGINVVGIIQGVQVDVTLDPYEPLPEGAILILIGATSVLEKISYMEVRKMITSTSNQRVKELSQIQKKSKIRSREGIFIAEGIRMVRETPHERLVGLYFSESFEKKYGKEVLDVISGGDLKVREQIRKKTEILSDAVFSYVSDTKTPQGVLAVVHQMEYTLGQMTEGAIPHLMILDNLQDPGNLGTIFRTAEAAGVTGIIMSRDCVDIYNPKTIRSTMGALYRMPFVYVEDLRENDPYIKRKKHQKLCGTSGWKEHL